MTWVDEHKEDGLWDSVAAAQSELRTLDQTELSEEDLSRLYRLTETMTRVADYRNHPDPWISAAGRKNVGKAVEDISAILPDLQRVFTPAPGASVSPFMKLVQLVRVWPVVLGATDTSALREFERLAQSATADLMERVDAASQSVEAIGGDVAEFKTTLDAGLKDLNEKSESLRKELKDEFDQAEAERDQSWGEFTKAKEKDAKEKIQSIEEQDKAAREILAELGRLSTASGYSQWATRQGRAALAWSIGAVLLFGVAAVLVIGFGLNGFGLIETSEGDGQAWWVEASTRLGLTALVTYAAFYATTQSSLHRDEQLLAQEKQLVLTTMGPFLLELPEHIQLEIKADSARSMFVDGLSKKKDRKGKFERPKKDESED